MRTQMPEKLESGRVREGMFATDSSWGPFGAYEIFGPCGEILRILANGTDPGVDRMTRGWEHVSVSTRRRLPNWTEMCFVKELFWEPEECVVQFHPPASEYVNNHPYCLHLWKSTLDAFPMPPSMMVGIKGAKMPPRKYLHERAFAKKP